MKGFSADIRKMVADNTSFRKVVYTAKHMQLVMMTLQPNEDIGEEIHKGNDQFFRVESGSGKAVIDGNEYVLAAGSVVVIPSGARHNITNSSDSLPLKLYTLYAPPHHKGGIVRDTKKEAAEREEEFDGTTTE